MLTGTLLSMHPLHRSLPASGTRRGRSCRPAWRLLAALALASACGAAPDAPAPGDDAGLEEHAPEALAQHSDALVGYDCSTHQDTGYTNGNPFSITLVTVDGNPVEIGTANAFLTMAQAANGAGIELRINSGFRTMAEQEYVYGCYINCNCNDCNKAASPGYSNHQSGHALDINTGGGALNWLNAHGGEFGFERTVPGESWHWEWWGGGSPKTFCSVAPPSCDRSAAGFTFSCDGPNGGQHCVNVNEPADPDSWSDNHFCSDQDLGMQWSISGPIAGMECINTFENSENHAAEWADNFLCLPPQSPYQLSWSSAGPIAGQSCVHWNEPSDTNSWDDNHVCIVNRTAFTSGPFTFAGAGPVADQTCISVNEPSDPHTWNDNFLCTRGDFGLTWSYQGAPSDQGCVNINEASDDVAQDWADNFLCAPPQTPWTFTWATAGQPAGATCVRWYEGADLASTWDDNWLCYEPVHRFSAGGFSFSDDGPVEGMSCVQVVEPDDADGWANDHVCGPAGLSLTWSAKGPVTGLDCTNIDEPAEPQAAAWADDFVCLPPNSGHKLTWSHAGPIAGKDCLRWFEHADTSPTWSDNWLCVEEVPVIPTPGAGGAGGEAGAGGKAGAGGEAGKAGGPGVSGASGQSSNAAGAKDPGAPHGERAIATESGCAAGPAGSRPVGAVGLVAGLALVAARRRRRG